MKKLFLFFLLSILFSCTKDEMLPTKNYRMTEITETTENSLYKYSFSYENNKIKQIIRSYNPNNQGWEVAGKTEYSYTNNSITRIDYSKNDSEFIIKEKQEMTFENTLLVNSVTYFYSNGAINYTERENYQYNTEGIYHIDFFRDDVLKDKQDFIYSDNQINIVHYYNPEGNWLEDHKIFIKYSGNQISSLETHLRMNIDDDWQYLDYLKSVYTNDTLSELQLYDWNYDSEVWYHDGTINFKYNAENKLEEIENIAGAYHCSIKYEEGETNLDNIIGPFSDILKGWSVQFKYIYSQK